MIWTRFAQSTMADIANTGSQMDVAGLYATVTNIRICLIVEEETSWEHENKMGGKSNIYFLILPLLISKHDVFREM